MRLKKLSLINFRNYSKQDFFTDARHVVLVGCNGSGKTNFLEAVNYLSITRSFRTSDEESLILHGQDFFNVSGLVLEDGSEEHKIEVIYSKTKGKQVLMDDKKIPVRNLVAHMKSVLFHTDDIELFRGSSSMRRRYLDVLLSQMDSNYYNHLVIYNHLMKQKREILKKKTLISCS